MKVNTLTWAYETVAHSLHDIGYSRVTIDMIREAHEAMRAGKTGEEMPHDFIGRFAEIELRRVWDRLEKMAA